MFEVEQKFHIHNLDDVQRALAGLDAVEGAIEQHSDSYFNHPCRDFAETTEALRVRRLNGIPMITYKGQKLPGAVKARQELEWALNPGDTDGTKMEKLLELLGFRPVAVVQKIRRPFTVSVTQSGDDQPLCVTVDDVKNLGFFAEIEVLVESSDDIEAARRQIINMAGRLGLRDAEPKSYLTMILESAK